MTSTDTPFDPARAAHDASAHDVPSDAVSPDDASRGGVASPTAARCGRCRWFDPWPFDRADVSDDPEGHGRCDWPSDRLPWSLRWGSRERVGVAPFEGAGCPCFEPAPEAGPEATPEGAPQAGA